MHRRRIPTASWDICAAFGPCYYVDGSANAADCTAQEQTDEWNKEPWGALDSRTVCVEVAGCSYVPLSSAKYGESFVFSGVTGTLASAYPFASAATPLITSITHAYRHWVVRERACLHPDLSKEEGEGLRLLQ